MGSGTSTQPLRIGRYALFEQIASGGMATVHLGRLLGEAGFARTVALKRMHPQCAKEPHFVAMFVDEARLAARVQHPNVVATLDVVTTRDELFLVMEYVRGESLFRLERAARERGERLAPRVASAILIGVLQGLHAAHEATNERGEHLGLVHRDVSSQNVLVGVDGIARVLDFGVAKAIGRLQTTREGQVKGKLAYMAPEQLNGRAATRRTDIYAAGVVLWEALTGGRLFAGPTDGETVNRVLSATVSAPSRVAPEVPRALDAIVLRALERDPDLRFSTAREMALALQAAIDPASASAVGELVERLAAPALAERAERVAEVESSTLLSPPDEAPAGAASTPVPAARPKRTRAASLALVTAAVIASSFAAALVLRDRGSPSLASTQAVTATVLPPPPFTATAPEPSGSAEPVPPPVAPLASPSLAPPSVTRGRAHYGSPARPRAPCEPPWYLDGAGIKRWKAECR